MNGLAKVYGESSLYEIYPRGFLQFFEYYDCVTDGTNPMPTTTGGPGVSRLHTVIECRFCWRKVVYVTRYFENISSVEERKSVH